jgi:hypothetical protein
MLKLQERKLTTQKGIDELHEFLKSFNFDEDIPSVYSDIKFFARIDIRDDSAKCDYENCSCSFLIEKGNLVILAKSENENYYDEQKVRYNAWKKRINFVDCIASFTSVVERYNKEVVEVEKEIETFLNFMQDWKNK